MIISSLVGSIVMVSFMKVEWDVSSSASTTIIFDSGAVTSFSVFSLSISGTSVVVGASVAGTASSAVVGNNAAGGGGIVVVAAI